MKNITIWFNKNKKVILTTIGTIAVVIIVVQLLNHLVIKNFEKEQNEIVTKKNDYSNELNEITLKSQESGISSEKVGSGKIKMLKTIDEFVSYCNEGKTKEAYSLLSNDCKEQMYSTQKAFEQGYYNNIFGSGKKTVSTEYWVGDTYKVKYSEDALSTGVYSKNSALQDYITIVQDEDGNYKLNINNYIGKQEISKSKEDNGIYIEAIETHIYMDYQEYKYKIKNNTENVILLDNLDNTSTMYIEDNNNVKYSAYTQEIAEANLRLAGNGSKEITIKYYSQFTSTKEIKNITFSKIILNYDVYSKLKDKNYYGNYASIQIDLR